MMSPKLWLSLAVVSAVGCDRPAAKPSTTATSAATTALEAPPVASSPAAPSAASPAAAASASAAASNETSTVTFNDEPVGAPSPSFEAVVGDWYVSEESGARGLKVDGSKWRSGTPSASIADQAKRLYGERYAQFLDGVKAFAFFPFAVWNGEPPTGDIRISMRFFPIAGQVDQGAGIAFAIAPDGSYLGVRANALEDNLLYFKVVHGKRTVFDDVRNLPTPTKTWHTLALEIRGQHIAAELDGKHVFDKKLDAPPVGKIGLWSKADSQLLFDDFRVEALSPPPAKPAVSHDVAHDP
jgi:hypothetical protein